MASYLRCLVTEEDQAKINEVDSPYQFNEAQHALNRASVLHHEVFLRYQDKLNQLKAEVRGLTEKRNSYKLLKEQCEGEAKSLRAKLEVARKENADLVEQVKIFEVSDDELGSVTNGRSRSNKKLIGSINCELRWTLSRPRPMNGGAG
nr:uncharacterized protein LOC104112831 [Nicotiana tomentosiformis]